MVGLGRAPTLGCNPAAPVAASCGQRLRNANGGVQIVRSRQVGGFLSLGRDGVLWSKEIHWRKRLWQPVVAASVAGGEAVAVSGARTGPFRILVLSLCFSASVIVRLRFWGSGNAGALYRSLF
jgi:hypothetical protein